MPPTPDLATRFAAGQLGQFGKNLLTSAGLTPDRANAVAEVLLEADLLGHTTHGLALLPAYLQAITEGNMKTNGDPSVISDTGATFTWDGRFLPGQWLVLQAVATARRRLQQHPVVTAVIRRSHHIGCLQAYLKPVTDTGQMIWLCCADPSTRTVAPPGGTEAQCSPNPIAAGIPTTSDPVLLDLTTAMISNNACRRAAAGGHPLPGPWLKDRNGQPTDDPQVLFEGRGGSILPLGGLEMGYKGFALTLFIEALTNALAGHGRATGETRWGASVFLQLLDPDQFGGRESFLRETSHLAQRCRETPAPPGMPPVLTPWSKGFGSPGRTIDQWG